MRPQGPDEEQRRAILEQEINALDDEEIDRIIDNLPRPPADFHPELNARENRSYAIGNAAFFLTVLLAVIATIAFNRNPERFFTPTITAALAVAIGSGVVVGRHFLDQGHRINAENEFRADQRQLLWQEHLEQQERVARARGIRYGIPIDQPPANIDEIPVGRPIGHMHPTGEARPLDQQPGQQQPRDHGR